MRGGRCFCSNEAPKLLLNEQKPLEKSGNTMPMPAEEIERLIKTALPDAVVELTALASDDDHWAATVTSAAFQGLSRVRQHQLVNAAFGGRLGDELHALALTTQALPARGE
jgi:stress-induced morphogen